MEQPELAEQSASQSASAHDGAPSSPSLASAATTTPPLQSVPSCPTCGGAAAPDVGSRAPSYVYALGRVEPRFPRLTVEKEFAQATGRSETTGLTDRQALHAVLSKRENRYLARQLCYVLTIEGIETYILRPRDPGDLDLLIEAVRPAPRPTDVDTVIGLRGPIAPPDLCNGLMVPIVVFDQMYSFNIDALIESIPRPGNIPEKKFAAAAEDLFTTIMQMTDNSGATDEHRALNYLAVRYPAIYARAAEEHGANASLTAVDVLHSRLSGVRKVVDVVFSYTDRATDVIKKFFVRVDVTEEFPFLVTKLSPYFDR